MSQAEVVVFDIGNVLVEWHPVAFYDRVIGPERRAAFFDEVPIDAVNLEVDRGLPMKETMYALAREYPDWGDEIRMWHDRWTEIAAPEIPWSTALLRALRVRGVPVFALTNFGDATFETAQQMYPVLTEFDRIYVSARLKAVKPEPEIYRMLEEDSGVDPATLLFADDRPENIETARARGWKGHIFDGPRGWAERLVTEELLTKEEAGL